MRAPAWLRPPLVVPLAVLLAGCAHGGAAGEARSASEDPAVTAEDVDRSASQPIEEVLQSRVPGAWVTRTPDGGIAIRIRGATSLRGDNRPLYVLDGMPVEPGPSGSLPGVNPHDIESIEVLTDAASTSMYGVRGANGVIVIKTKRSGR